MAATVTELESQLQDARAQEQQERRAKEDRQREQDRALRGLELANGGEIRRLKDSIDRALATKAPAAVPSPELRGLARAFVHGGLEYFSIERLAKLDPRFGLLFGLNSAAQQLYTRMAATGILAAELYSLTDRLEIATWRAVLARGRYLGGEVDL